MADENTDPPKKKSPIMLILAGVFGGIILVGGGLGAGYFLFGGNQPGCQRILHKKYRVFRRLGLPSK